MADVKSTIFLCIFAIFMIGMSESKRLETRVRDPEKNQMSVINVTTNSRITFQCDIASRTHNNLLIKWFFEPEYGRYEKKNLRYHDGDPTMSVFVGSPYDTGKYSCELTGIKNMNHFRGFYVFKVVLPGLETVAPPVYIPKGKSATLVCEGAEVLRNPEIKWYFKGAASEKTYLHAFRKEIDVAVMNGKGVGEYSCEFYETGKQETIEKMIIPVTSNVTPGPSRNFFSLFYSFLRNVGALFRAVVSLYKPSVDLDIRYTLDVSVRQ